MNEFEKRIALTLGMFGAILSPHDLGASICVLLATGIWIARSLAARATEA